MTSRSRALVTIVVPVYNATQYLHECLSSVVAQTVRDWEAVVVDDGSLRGDSGAVVREVGDGRIRLVRHRVNRGLAAARNTGISQARGYHVVPLDADDRLAPTYLQQTLDASEKGEYDAAFTDFQVFGDLEGRTSYSVRDVPALLTEQWIPGAGTLFRRSLWEAVGGYCEADALRPGNEDWEFWLSAAERGFRAVNVPEPLYLYRLHAESMMRRLEYHDYQTREFIYRRHPALFDRYRLKNAFLSRGYLSSAKAHWRKGERPRAIALAARSLVLAPADCLRRLADQAIRSVRARPATGDAG
jgi:glycosyltransferase involved in cell wall biosynthesis